MGFSTAVGLGLSALNAVGQRNASSNARNALTGSAQQGIDAINSGFEGTQANLNPFIQSGIGALNKQNAVLNGDFSGFDKSPDFLFARDQMQQGIERGAAARGSLFSGGTNLDLANALNGLASQNLNNYFAKLAGMSGQGLQAGQALGSFAANRGNSLAELFGNQGQARASAFGQRANINSGLFGDVANGFGSFFGAGG